MLLFCAPNFGKFEGHVAFGLSVYVCVCVGMGVGWGVCQWGCVHRVWLAGSVGHFFETLYCVC